MDKTRKTNPNSLANLNPKARYKGKVRRNTSLLEETIGWLERIGGNVSQGIEDLVAAAKAGELKPVDAAQISKPSPPVSQCPSFTSGAELDSLNQSIAQALVEVEELKVKRKQDLDFSHVRAVGLSAEIENLESKLQLPALEKVRDRVLLKQPPAKRRELKKVLDQFAAALASGGSS
jgi:hypothetical protein